MYQVDVKKNVKIVLEKIEAACLKRSQELQYIQPRLVAATKTKPVELIVEAYESGQRHFGENYVQEFEDKANNPVILEKCKDIKWHFIGHLQTNKINKMLQIPNLYVIETVHSEKLATNLDKSWPKFGPPDSRLNIMIQINTSREEGKNGIPPEEAVNFTQYVLNYCPNLQLQGFMTIGKYGYDPKDGPNPDFIRLKECRDQVCQSLGLDWKKLQISMGMSTDYEQAVELGSTNVRVGTAIFGERPTNN